MKNTKYCSGCRSNLYNGNNEKCGFFGKAKIVTRYRIGAWTMPAPSARKLKTFHCHQGEGYVDYTKKQLPGCVVEIVEERE